MTLTLLHRGENLPTEASLDITGHAVAADAMTADATDATDAPDVDVEPEDAPVNISYGFSAFDPSTIESDGIDTPGEPTAESMSSPDTVAVSKSTAAASPTAELDPAVESDVQDQRGEDEAVSQPEVSQLGAEDESRPEEADLFDPEPRKVHATLPKNFAVERMRAEEESSIRSRTGSVVGKKGGVKSLIKRVSTSSLESSLLVDKSPVKTAEGVFRSRTGSVMGSHGAVSQSKQSLIKRASKLVRPKSISDKCEEVIVLLRH